MATKKHKSIKSLTKNELSTKIRETEQELFKSRLNFVTGQLESTSSIWKLRKDLARYKTYLGQSSASESQKG